MESALRQYTGCAKVGPDALFSGTSLASESPQRRTVMNHADPLYSKAKVAGHPLHPMLVAFPVAFYTGAFAASNRIHVRRQLRRARTSA
jgi:hypothetical protein